MTSEEAHDCGSELIHTGEKLSEIRCKKCAPKLKAYWPRLIAWGFRLRDFKRAGWAICIAAGAAFLVFKGSGTLPVGGRAVGNTAGRAPEEVSSAKPSSGQLSLAQVSLKSAQLGSGQTRSDELAPDAPVAVNGYWRNGFWVNGHMRTKAGTKMKAAE